MTNISWVTVADLQLELKYKDSKVILQNLLGEEDLWDVRLIDHFNNFQQAINHAVNNNVSFFIIAGDVFERINPSERLKKLFIKALRPLISARIPIFIPLGNHDTDGSTFNLSGERELINAMYDAPIIKIIEESFCITKGANKFVFLSWMMNDTEKIKKVLSGEYEKDCIIFGHLEMDLATLNDHEVRLSNGLSRALFVNHRAVYLGHFHRPQKISDQVQYVGSIAKEGFGERLDEKTFIHSQLNANGSITDNYIPITDRAFVQFDVTETTPEVEYKIQPGSVVKVVFFGTSEWIKSVDKYSIKKRLLEQDAVKITFANKYSQDNTKVDSFITMDTTFDDAYKSVCEEDNKIHYFEPGINILNKVREHKDEK